MRTLLVTIGLTVALAASACSSSEPTTVPTTVPTTTAPTTTVIVGDGSIVFGEGAVPDGVPSSFPIPQQGNIGSTLADDTLGRYEMLLNLPAPIDATVAYYETNLPAVGFVIDRSELEGLTHMIAFSGEGVTGLIQIEAKGTGELSTASIRIERS